jgi:hypothetical protein
MIKRFVGTLLIEVMSNVPFCFTGQDLLLCTCPEKRDSLFMVILASICSFEHSYFGFRLRKLVPKSSHILAHFFIQYLCEHAGCQMILA